MPYDPLQLQTDVDFITSQPQWQDEKTRRDYIRQVGVQAKGNLDNEAHTELMNTLWGKMDTRGKLQKAGEFVGTAVGEVVKSIPATFGAVGTAISDVTGLTDTGSGARLKAGVSGLVDTAGQRIKQLAPNDRQGQRDTLIESLREDIDKGAVPQGFEKWLAGDYDNKEIDDPETKAFVDAVVSGISRAGTAADKMGDIDYDSLRGFMESDRNPARADSDIPGEMGARQFLADYVATRDPQSWQQFKERVTETEAQYKNRLSKYVAQKPQTEAVLANMPEGLEKDLVQRSLAMQESPIDLASALIPAVRGAKALQAAKAGGFGAAAGRFAKGAAIEGAQEAGTEALQDPRATAAQIAEAGALGAVGAGALEAGAAGVGAASRRLSGVPAAAQPAPETPQAPSTSAAESVTVESGEMPLPKVLKDLEEKVKVAVDANADVLPATKAALEGLESGLTDAGEGEGDVRQGLATRRKIAVPGQEGITDLGAPEGDVLSLVPKKSPAAPPAEPSDATEGQPTPGGVGAPPVVTNEPQTPAPAEQPVSAAETPVATEPEAPLPETEKVVAPKAETEQGAGMSATKEQSYTVEEKANFTKTPREARGDRFVISSATGMVFDRLFSTSVTPPAFSKTEDAVNALNESAYNTSLPVPVSLGQREDGSSFFTSAYKGLPEVALPSSSGILKAPKAETEQGAGMTQRDTSKPEQMTPEEWAEASKARQEKKTLARIASLEQIIKVSSPDAVQSELRQLEAARKSLKQNREWRVQDLTGNHPLKVEEAAKSNLPVSAEAVDAYGITLPEGYVRQGDLYVFAPEAPPAQEPKTKPEDASKNQVEEAGGTPPVEGKPAETRPEGQAQEGAAQRSREGEEVAAETAAPGAEPGAAAARDTSKPEQMTPEKETEQEKARREWQQIVAERYAPTWGTKAFSQTTVNKEYVDTEQSRVSREIIDLVSANKSVPVSLTKKAGIAGIEGYVRQGDLYVYQPAQKSATPEFGSSNTIFTKERAEEAAKVLRRKLGQTNVPAFDYELFAAATEYAGFLIEGGARKFGDFSSKMLSEFGEAVRPILKGVYSGVRELEILDGMDDAATVDKALAGETKAAEPAAAPAEPALPQTQQTPVARPSGEPFAAPTAESRAEAPEQIATARSVIDAERKRLGRPPVEGPIMDAISDEQIYAQAKAEYDKDPKVGDRLVDSINARPRAVDSLQQAILGQELVRRRNALDIASDAYIADPKNTELEDAFNEASAKYEQAKFAAQYGISDVGRTLRLARVLLNLDFSKAGLITRFRQASGGVDPNAEQLKKIDELSKTILDSEQKIEELRSAKEENARLQELLDNIIQDMKAQAVREFGSVEKARKEAKEAFKAASSMKRDKVSALDTLEEKIRSRRAERKKKVMADPFLINALADAIDDVMLGAIKIAKGVRNVARWMSEMRAENPDYTDEQLQDIRKASESFYENELKPELGAEAPAAEVAEEETLEDEEGEEGKVFVTFDDVTGRDIYRMVKDRVQKGMTEVGEVMQSVTEEIQQQLPDVTERQVRDRFSGYGRPLFPSQEANAKKVREIRTLAQYASKIEDAQKKIAPLRSGRQRDDATDAIRQAQKELYRLMKENGLEMPPGPRSIKAPLDVIKRRLRNRLDDLKRQQAAGKRDVVSTKKIERDAEAKALEEEIRVLEEALDALDPPLPKSYQDKVKDRMRSVDKEIADLRRKIKDKDVSKRESEPIITAQLQVKLDERAVLKQALDDLRIEIEGEPQLTQEEINERAERILDRNIKNLQTEIDQLKDPNFYPQTEQKAEATPAIIRLRKQQEILRQERARLSEERFGKKVKSESERADIAIAALEKSIDNINNKIITGDLSPASRKGTPIENAKIKNLRAERDSLKSVMALMRKAKADAAKDPVAEQIRRDRKYLESRIEYYENIQKQIASGTYKPKVKEQRKYDESLGKELQKLEDAKNSVADMLLQEKLKNRSTLRKAFDYLGDLFSLHRLLVATADISAIGNQGNFTLFSNPLISLRALPDMFRAMRSPEGEKIIQENIRSMPEYKDGEFNRVGLYLAMDAGPNSPISKMEEQYATRLAQKWPSKLGGGIIRGSERAYKTFLDLIRVASYKAMKETLVKGGWFTPPKESTQERLESIAYLINNATGRGSFKIKKADQIFNQASPFLNTFIFAAKFGLSRFAMALGMPLWRASEGTRALIAQEYAKYVIGVSIGALLLALKQDEEDEPTTADLRSSNAFKTNLAGRQIDLLGGFQQPLVFLTRLFTGETITQKGKVRTLREGDRPLDLFREHPLKATTSFGSREATDVVWDFLRFKLAPTTAAILNAINGKDPVGNRTDLKSEIIKAPFPIGIGQLVENITAEDPSDAAILSTLGVTGLRTSYRGENEDKNKTAWEKMVKKVEELTGIK